MQRKLFWTLCLWLFFSVIFFISSNRALAESPDDLKKEESQIRSEMIEWSEQLGVTCTECHSLKNFKSSTLNSFKVGLEHSKIVHNLRKQGFDGAKGPLANCLMCHRGELRPQYEQTQKSYLDLKLAEKKAEAKRAEEKTTEEKKTEEKASEKKSDQKK